MLVSKVAPCENILIKRRSTEIYNTGVQLDAVPAQRILHAVDGRSAPFLSETALRSKRNPLGRSSAVGGNGHTAAQMEECALRNVMKSSRDDWRKAQKYQDEAKTEDWSIFGPHSQKKCGRKIQALSWGRGEGQPQCAREVCGF